MKRSVLSFVRPISWFDSFIHCYHLFLDSEIEASQIPASQSAVPGDASFQTFIHEIRFPCFQSPATSMISRSLTYLSQDKGWRFCLIFLYLLEDTQKDKNPIISKSSHWAKSNFSQFTQSHLAVINQQSLHNDVSSSLPSIMFKPTVLRRATSLFHPVGNSPAVNLAQHFPPERPPNILLLECGDAGNVLFTSYMENPRSKSPLLMSNVMFTYFS